MAIHEDESINTQAGEQIKKRADLPAFGFTRFMAGFMVFLGTMGFFIAPLATFMSAVNADTRDMQPIDVTHYWLRSILMLGFGLLIFVATDIARNLDRLASKDK